MDEAAPPARHPGLEICASAIYFVLWAIWVVFCIVNINGHHAALTASVPGAVGIVVMAVGVVMTPIWVMHVLCTLALRHTFRPRWSMTALAATVGAAGLVVLWRTPSMNNEVFYAVALTAAAALCSGICDMMHNTVAICPGEPAAGQEQESLLGDRRDGGV